MSLPWQRALTDSECASDAPVPGDEIGKQLETGAVALFRMELHGEDISACNRASKRRWIGDGCSCCAGVLGYRIVAVREVEARAILYAVPERMLSHEVHGAPPHVRHLEADAVSILHRAVTEAHHVACEHAQAGSGSFLAVLKEHLQAEADAEERAIMGSVDHDLGEPACAEAPHAVGHRALTRQHDAI